VAAPLVDITLLGDRELERKLARLVGPAQKRVVRRALRDTCKRIHRRLIRKVSGHPVGIVTGKYLAAIKAEKPSAGKRGRSVIQIVLAAPREAEQAIQQNALEYGRKKGRGAPAPAYPHVRPAVDEKKRSDLRLIGRDIGRGIVREAKKK
jgi:hypothetical protein